MALQSLAGFTAAAISPIAVGFILDITGGGKSTISWGLTFGAMSITAFLGLFLLFRAQNKNSNT
jgi:cyanate permease